MELSIIREFEEIFQNSLKLLNRQFNNIIYLNSTYGGDLTKYGRRLITNLSEWVDNYLNVLYGEYYKLKRYTLLEQFKNKYSKCYILDNVYKQFNLKYNILCDMLKKFDYKNINNINTQLRELEDFYDNKILDIENDLNRIIERQLISVKKGIVTDFLKNVANKPVVISWIMETIMNKYKKGSAKRELIMRNIPWKYKIFNVLWKNKIKNNIYFNKI